MPSYLEPSFDPVNPNDPDRPEPWPGLLRDAVVNPTSTSGVRDAFSQVVGFLQCHQGDAQTLDRVRSEWLATFPGIPQAQAYNTAWGRAAVLLPYRALTRLIGVPADKDNDANLWAAIGMEPHNELDTPARTALQDLFTEVNTARNAFGFPHRMYWIGRVAIELESIGRVHQGRYFWEVGTASADLQRYMSSLGQGLRGEPQPDSGLPTAPTPAEEYLKQKLQEHRRASTPLIRPLTGRGPFGRVVQRLGGLATALLVAVTLTALVAGVTVYRGAAAIQRFEANTGKLVDVLNLK